MYNTHYVSYITYIIHNLHYVYVMHIQYITYSYVLYNKYLSYIALCNSIRYRHLWKDTADSDATNLVYSSPTTSVEAELTKKSLRKQGQLRDIRTRDMTDVTLANVLYACRVEPAQSDIVGLGID